MIRLNFRLRRTFITVWCLALWAYLAIFPHTYEKYYPTPADRESYVTGMQHNPAFKALWGPLDSPGTIGQIVMWEAGSMGTILAAIMAVLLIVSLHRGAEGHGLTELQLSAGVSRIAPAAAAIVTTAIVAVLVGGGSTAVLGVNGMYVEEMPIKGAFATGATIALTMFGAALLAQFVLLFIGKPTAQTRTALLTVAVAFIARATVDRNEIQWLNWASPLGWKSLVRPYVHDDWSKAGLLVLVCVSLTILLLVAETRREVHETLVPVPSLSSTRTRRIHGPLHLASILNWPTVVTWVFAMGVLNAFFLATAGSISEWLEANVKMGQIFLDMFGEGDLKAQFIEYSLKILGILIAVMAVQLVLTYRAAELERTIDLQRSTGIRGFVPLVTVSTIAALGVMIGVGAAFGGGALGLMTQETTVAADYELLAYASVSQLGPALMLGAIAALIIGTAPRYSQLSWAPVVATASVTLFGPIFQMPTWVMNFSPFEYMMTATQGSTVPHLAMSTSAALIFGLAWRALSLRDIA